MHPFGHRLRTGTEYCSVSVTLLRWSLPLSTARSFNTSVAGTMLQPKLLALGRGPQQQYPKGTV
jgi:hypothetical protein